MEEPEPEQAREALLPVEQCEMKKQLHVMKFGGTSVGDVSVHRAFDLRDQTKSTFEGFAGVETDREMVQTEDGTPEQISVASVTTNFFRLLGANIAYGRDFSDQDGLPEPPDRRLPHRRWPLHACRTQAF